MRAYGILDVSVINSVQSLDFLQELQDGDPTNLEVINYDLDSRCCPGAGFKRGHDSILHHLSDYNGHKAKDNQALLRGFNEPTSIAKCVALLSHTQSSYVSC